MASVNVESEFYPWNEFRLFIRLNFNKCEYNTIFKRLLNFLANHSVATKTAHFITITSSNTKLVCKSV